MKIDVTFNQLSGICFEFMAGACVSAGKQC